MALGGLLLLAACESAAGSRETAPQEAAPAVAAPMPRPAPVPVAAVQRLARERPSETVCQRFARHFAIEALHHPDDVIAFLRGLQQKFTAGEREPFALRESLDAQRWNPAYIYAGHGGFRPEYDDDSPGNRHGGNHQPGHFVSVLSIATEYGPDAARIGLAYAGDYEPDQEDDLRLSRVAIRLGEGLRAGALGPASVAGAAAGLCRPD